MVEHFSFLEIRYLRPDHCFISKPSKVGIFTNTAPVVLERSRGSFEEETTKGGKKPAKYLKSLLCK